MPPAKTKSHTRDTPLVVIIQLFALWGRVFQFVDVAAAKKKGIHAICLCVDGTWTTVVVDDPAELSP